MIISIEVEKSILKTATPIYDKSPPKTGPEEYLLNLLKGIFWKFTGSIQDNVER